MENVIYSSAKTLAGLVSKGEVSAVELVEGCMSRIEEVNPKLNAVVQFCTGRAMEEAKAADESRAKGDSLGPLHGVPMTIKDSLDTESVISTGGTLGRATFVPEEDATVVKRLRGAGAILLGKTNTPELTLHGETDNLVYGRTNNPYDLDRSPNGSSGGAAAIVSSGGVPFDLGSDTGGSIRAPAPRLRYSGNQTDFRAGVEDWAHRAVGDGGVGCVDDHRADDSVRGGPGPGLASNRWA